MQTVRDSAPKEFVVGKGVNQTLELGARQWCDLSEEKTASAMGGWEARGSFQQKVLDRTSHP